METVKMNGKCQLYSCFHALHRSSKKRNWRNEFGEKKSYKMAATAHRKIKVAQSLLYILLF